jgi:uncharacterized protein (TIGR03437 family)
MSARRLAPALLVLATVLTANAYIRSTATGTVEGPPLFRTDFEAIQFQVQSLAAPGFANRDGRPVISPTSEPLAALQAALDTWSSIESSAVRFLPLQPTVAGFDLMDGRNTLVFEDTPATRSLTGGAPAVTALRIDPDGRIVESDIVFNPSFRPGNNQVPFSTDLALNTVDLQATATHHLGRALGATNSGVLGAAMFGQSELSQSFRRTVTSDDAAFATDVYPAPGALDSAFEIFGTIRIGDELATGVLVTAIEPTHGYIQSTLTSLSDGTYRLKVPSVPQSRYLVYVESLDGPLLPSQLQTLNLNRFRTDLRPRFFGNNLSPLRVDSLPGRSTRVDIRAEGGAEALKIELIGVDEPGSSGRPPRLSAGPIRLIAGRAHDIVLAGLGVDATVGAEAIRLLAPGVTVRPGSIRVDPEFTVGGGPVLRMTVDVEPRTDPRIGTIGVVESRAADFFTGALLIEPIKPALSQGGVVNAASFEPTGVAPGGLYSLFGEGLGPVEGLAAEGFDPATGRLPTTLGGVRVLFDGEPAPLIFVSEGQVNLQAPYEIAGRENTVISVGFGGLSGDPIRVPVVATAPGIFQIGGTQAAALNADGSINGPGNPAGRAGFVTLFANGQGLVDPAARTGAPAPADPLRRARNVRVRIGGVEVPPDDILFAGLAPGFVGLLQINIRLSNLYPVGPAVEVSVTIGGGASQTATLAIN